MNTLKHILQNYEAKLDDKIDYLVEAGLFEEKKVGMLKRAINKNPNNLTMAESKVLREFVDNVVSQLLYEKQDHLSAYDKKMNKNKNVDKELPVVIILKRKAIRVYPDNQKVALYYSQALDRYISIPYGPKGEALGMTMNESIDTKVNPQDSNKVPSANPKSPSEREMKKDVDTSDILKNMQKNEPVNPRMDFAPSADPKMRIDEVSQQMATRAYKKGAENIKSIENDPNLDAVQKTIRISKIKQKMEMLSHRMKTNVADVKTGKQIRDWAGLPTVDNTEQSKINITNKGVNFDPKTLKNKEQYSNIKNIIKNANIPISSKIGMRVGMLGRRAYEKGKEYMGKVLKGELKESSFRNNLNILRENEQYDKTDAALDAASMIPGPAGVAATLVSSARNAKRGNYTDAALDAVGALPVAGYAAKAVKVGRVMSRVSKASKQSDALKNVEKLTVKNKGRIRKPESKKDNNSRKRDDGIGSAAAAAALEKLSGNSGSDDGPLFTPTTQT